MAENMGPEFRLTHQRRAILDMLRSLKTHPTADEVYQRVREILPRISLGTVYRNLEILANAGMIVRLDVPGRKKRFDGCVSFHHHIRCIDCGRIEDVCAESLPDGIDCRAEGFEQISCRMEFTGICMECSKGRKVAEYLAKQDKVL